jgi:hypothetical protein
MHRHPSFIGRQLAAESDGPVVRNLRLCHSADTPA